MTRGRRPPDVEAAREVIETDLAALGTARKWLEMASERIGVAELDEPVVGPAMDYLQKADRLIRKVQRSLAARAPGSG